MKPDHSFERQLANLDHEATVIANYVYAKMTIEHAASQSKKLLHRLNYTPTFWITCNAALQIAAHIALGRVFDLKSPYNLSELIVSMERDPNASTREAFASRKRGGLGGDPPWLQEYVDAAYYPKRADIARLRKHVENYRKVYDRAFMPARHRYLAHRQALGHANVQSLFAKGKVKELWRLSTFLVRLHTALWELLHNGKRPVLRPIRFSVRQIYKSSVKRSGPHERIVDDTRRLMNFIEQAMPNPSLNADVPRAGLRPRSGPPVS